MGFRFVNGRCLTCFGFRWAVCSMTAVSKKVLGLIPGLASLVFMSSLCLRWCTSLQLWLNIPLNFVQVASKSCNSCPTLLLISYKHTFLIRFLIKGSFHSQDGLVRHSTFLYRQILGSNCPFRLPDYSFPTWTTSE